MRCALVAGVHTCALPIYPLCRKASRKGDSVLLCYADIEGAIRKSLLELVQTSARRHGRGDGADRGIALRLGNQGLGKNICIAWRPWRSFGLLADYHVEIDKAAWRERVCQYG